MNSTEGVDSESHADQGAAHLEDLIPIAVVIAAGCESCADSMVKRALQNGATRRQVAHALGIVAHLRSSDCFLKAVGAELAERMDRPLAAGRSALRAAREQSETCSCCAPAADSESPEPRLV
jgi:AhpD family alkylhydroperoxidase